MQVITEELLNAISQKAKGSVRKRMNYNFHSEDEAPVNRLLNALEPETYLPPHRHKNPDKEEMFLVLRGSVAFFTFDDEGKVLSSTIVSPDKGVYGMDIEAAIWHSLVVLEKNTVVYETKEGPYAPLAAENFASWAPGTDDVKGIRTFTEHLLAHLD